VIVVGSHLDDPGGFNAAGSAYVFVHCGGGWIEAARLTHPSPAAGDQFGFRVRVDGDTIAVGSPGDDTTATDGGSIQVFDRDDNGTPQDPCDDTWVFGGQILPSVCQASSWFSSAGFQTSTFGCAPGSPTGPRWPTGGG
jgi:hypothetical protein